VFGRATITLGIGPQSSLFCCLQIPTTLVIQVDQSAGCVCVPVCLDTDDLDLDDL